MLRTAEIKILRSIAGKTLRDRVKSGNSKRDLQVRGYNQMGTKAYKILTGPCRKNGPPRGIKEFLRD